MAKDIKYNADARNGLIAGIDKLAETEGQKRGSGPRIRCSAGNQ